jgi:Trans-aconitate methyltransferase
MDSSEEMVGEARRNHSGPEFVVGDARNLSFEDEFDAVFSNAALHWILEDDQSEVVEGVARSLRDGGRFVAELGGSGNISHILGGVRDGLTARGYEYDNPWYFPTVGEYAFLLEESGFEVRRIVLFDRPTEIGGDKDGLRSWLKMYGGSIFSEVPDDERSEIYSAIEDDLRDELFDTEEESWTADYRRLRFVAYKK